MTTPITRRDLIVAGAGAAAWAACAVHPAAAKGKDDDEVSANEDLMREHGLLERVLIIYEEALPRLGKDAPPAVIADSAAIIRKFVEDYHERNEEEFGFPRLEKGPQAALVTTLRAQHQAGRRLTDGIVHLAAARDAASRHRLDEAVRAFVRMYRPHAAREDTVLFPAFHASLSKKDYAKLGDAFEDKEHQMLGADGFEGMLAKVAGIEKQLGIDDIARFTPASVVGRL
jgi:hemerythrin-like domain-containing protein